MVQWLEHYAAKFQKTPHLYVPHLTSAKAKQFDSIFYTIYFKTPNEWTHSSKYTATLDVHMLITSTKS